MGRSELGRTAWTYATNGASKGTIFFLHGTCDSGQGLKNWVARVLRGSFQFKDYRILYPSAPIRPYHLMNGQNAAVWYDRLSHGPNLPEDICSINQVGDQLSKMIRLEQEREGTKVIVGGFAMGGSMALHLAYRLNPNVAGVFALSAFLPPDSAVFSDLAAFVKENPPSPAGEEKPLRLGGEDLRSTSKTGKVESSSLAATKKLPKLFMSLGTKDPLVRYRWGQSTFDQLRTYGINGHLFTFQRQSHEITRPQLSILHNWIEETMRDSPKPKITQTKQFHINDEGTMPVPFKRWPKSS
ncbi:lysophospholipase-like protein 1 [Folsomia candida]|uniref:lysophospholipase-like protein 1 n=1 Tax=Folsomia candida TaxID=158441 RepID=UPI000B8EF21F|nr:lysophospholipase-like protein 1 [Folsomia candida]